MQLRIQYAEVIPDWGIAQLNWGLVKSEARGAYRGGAYKKKGVGTKTAVNSEFS